MLLMWAVAVAPFVNNATISESLYQKLEQQCGKSELNTMISPILIGTAFRTDGNRK